MGRQAIRALRWVQTGLEVLDQRLLPAELAYHRCDTVDDVARAIESMKVRGAPAIGIAAAYGVVLAARSRFNSQGGDWISAVEADLELLARSRPTAVNLFWALDRMRKSLSALDPSLDPEPTLLAEAQKIHDEDVISNQAMGETGAALLAGSRGVLTHCNTGALATGGHGTALGVIRSACALYPLEVFATETRPWSQGARLTLWELDQERIAATLIADSTAASLMRLKKIDWVIVGADRIAANGDTANKIGTYSLAVLARHHGVRFMVVAPSSTIDWGTATGEGITIEERTPAELLPESFQRPDSVVGAWNPVFDVTPAHLIDVIVTDAGAVMSPSAESMLSLC